MIDFRNCCCMEMMAEFPDKHFDLAIVDPPYGIDVTKMNMGGRLRNTEDKKKSWDTGVPDTSYFAELFRVSKNQIIWGGNYFDLPPSQYFAVWDKGESLRGRSFAEGEYAWVRKGGTRIKCMHPNQLDRHHPTQKPIELYTWLLANYAKAGDLILDTHVGSASSLIACHQMGFDVVGCELDEEYYALASNRIADAMAQTSLFAGSE